MREWEEGGERRKGGESKRGERKREKRGEGERWGKEEGERKRGRGGEGRRGRKGKRRGEKTLWFKKQRKHFRAKTPGTSCFSALEWHHFLKGSLLRKFSVPPHQHNDDESDCAVLTVAGARESDQGTRTAELWQSPFPPDREYRHAAPPIVTSVLTSREHNPEYLILFRLHVATEYFLKPIIYLFIFIKNNLFHETHFWIMLSPHPTPSRSSHLLPTHPTLIFLLFRKTSRQNYTNSNNSRKKKAIKSTEIHTQTKMSKPEKELPATLWEKGLKLKGRMPGSISGTTKRRQIAWHGHHRRQSGTHSPPEGSSQAFCVLETQVWEPPP